MQTFLETSFPKKPLSRRSLLEWLGKSVVLSLGGGMLHACTSGHGRDLTEKPPADVSFDAAKDLLNDANGTLPESDMATRDGVTSGSFPFEPGALNKEVFTHWGERTVDEQNLLEILSNWRLTIDGLVENPVTLTFTELLSLERQDQVMDFHCVEGWTVQDVPWNGVHLSRITERVRPTSGVSHLNFHTIGDRYNESLPIKIIFEPHTMLAYGVDGSTLPLIHGFPLRVVIPRLFGYKNAKYIERMEFADHPIKGFWVAAGYSYDGEVPESRLRPGKY